MSLSAATTAEDCNKIWNGTGTPAPLERPVSGATVGFATDSYGVDPSQSANDREGRVRTPADATSCGLAAAPKMQCLQERRIGSDRYRASLLGRAGLAALTMGRAMTNDFAIVETFEITGRGAVAVLDKPTGREVGRALLVQVLKPSGEAVSTEAFKEWLLRRQPVPHEKEAFMLKGLRKDDLPAGTLLRFLD